MAYDYDHAVELHCRKALGLDTFKDVHDTGLTLAQAVRRVVHFPDLRADPQSVTIHYEGQTLTYTEIAALYEAPDFPRAPTLSIHFEIGRL